VSSVNGFNSAEYKNALKMADSEVGRIWQRMISLNLDKNSLIIITSDHGGPSRLTVENMCMTSSCMEIPFILYGPTVNNSNGNVIQDYVRNFDVAATALHALGAYKLPTCWISKPIALGASSKYNPNGDVPTASKPNVLGIIVTVVICVLVLVGLAVFVIYKKRQWFSQGGFTFNRLPMNSEDDGMLTEME